MRKDKKCISEKVSDVNGWKNYYSQTKLDLIDKQNIAENHLRAKLHLKTKKGITIIACNLLKYLRSSFWGLSNCNCHMETPVDESKFSEKNTE